MNVAKFETVTRDLDRARSDYLATSRAAEHYTTTGYLVAEQKAWEQLEAALLAVEIHEMGVTS